MSDKELLSVIDEVIDSKLKSIKQELKELKESQSNVKSELKDFRREVSESFARLEDQILNL